MEDGQRYVWDTVVGWCADYGEVTVTIMDVESDGHRFYTDPDGNVRLDRVVTPSGEVIERDYGTLPPGRYRFVSSVFLIDEEGNTGCHNDLFHEFVIE